MTTKNMFAVLLVLAMGIGSAFSQKDHKKFDPQVRMDKKLNKMDEVVKFTGTQRNEIQVLFTQSMQKKKDAFCSHETGTEDMKNAMKAVRTETEDGLKKILSGDQFKLWMDYKKNYKKEHHHKSGKGKGKLDMTGRIDGQLEKIDSIVKFTGIQRDDMKALLTDFAKRSKDTFCTNELGSDGFKNAMKTIKEDKRSAIEKILSKDQMDLWKAHKKNKHKDRK